jgi:hypothetical protein
VEETTRNGNQLEGISLFSILESIYNIRGTSRQIGVGHQVPKDEDQAVRERLNVEPTF